MRVSRSTAERVGRIATTIACGTISTPSPVNSKMLFACLALIGLLHPAVHVVSAQGIYLVCTTPNQEPGVCINIRSCQPLLNLLQREGLAAGDYLWKSLCTYPIGDPIVCCPGYPKTESKIETENLYKPLQPPHCGFSNASHTRVVGGVPAQLNAYPWIAALGYRNDTNSSNIKWLCGGSLITTRHVLTAAHCIRRDLTTIRVGDLDLDDDDEGAHPVQVDVERTIVHPGYRKRTFVNDIAVVRLAQEIPLSQYVYPICLPLEDSLRNDDFSHESAFVAGWGSTAYRGPTTSHLREVQLSVISNKDCKLAYSQFKRAVIDDRVLCAGYARRRKDACQGDSGGPFMLPNGTTLYQIGVVSYGYKCAELKYPGIYSRVTEFLDFIISALR